MMAHQCSTDENYYLIRVYYHTDDNGNDWRCEKVIEENLTKAQAISLAVDIAYDYNMRPEKFPIDISSDKLMWVPIDDVIDFLFVQKERN